MHMITLIVRSAFIAVIRQLLPIAKPFNLRVEKNSDTAPHLCQDNFIGTQVIAMQRLFLHRSKNCTDQGGIG